MGRFEKIGSLATFTALVIGSVVGPAWALPQSSPVYQGNDPGRIPADMQRFVVTEGLEISNIKSWSDGGVANLTYILTSKVLNGYRGQEYRDQVHVNVYWYNDPENTDTAFKRRVVQVTCPTANSLSNHHCKSISLAANVVGIMDIAGPEGYPQYPVKQTDDYVVELRGTDNAVVEVWGGIYSNWSTDETIIKSIASQLAGLGPTRVLNQAQGADGVATAPSPPPSRAVQKQNTAVNVPPIAAPPPVVQRVADTAAIAWAAVPPVQNVVKSIIGKSAFVIERNSDNRLDCSNNEGVKRLFDSSGQKKIPSRLLDDKSLILQALQTLNLSDSEAAALLAAIGMPESDIPAAVRERSYILWEPSKISDFLSGLQLNLNYASKLDGGFQKIAWRTEPALLQRISTLSDLCPPASLFSSEHSSIRGSINGGGDFIDYTARPAGEPRLIPIDASPALQTLTVELPGTTVTMPYETVIAIDLAPNGIAAVAVSSGSAQITERSTGARRSIGPNQLALSVPGIGVSKAMAMTAAASQNLAEAQHGPAGAQAAPSPIPPNTASAGMLSQIQTARDVAFGHPVSSGDVFEAGTEPVFVWFHHEGVAPGSRITAVWYFLETAQPLEIGRGDVVVQPPSDWGQFSYSLGDGKSWPQGRYRVDLLLNGQPTGSTAFRIAPGAAPSGATGPGQAAPKSQTYSDAGAGYSLEMPADWERNTNATDDLLMLLNRSQVIGMEMTLQHNAERIPDKDLYALVEKHNHDNAEFQIVSSRTRYIPAINRTAYLLLLRARKEDGMTDVLLVPREGGGASHDYYMFKIAGAAARRDAIDRAMEQIVSGFNLR